MGNGATFTYNNATHGTTTQWAAGTNWTASPVSASDTTLIFGGGAPLVNGDVITSNNDVANPFLLNALTINYSGSGADNNFPQVIISGGTLNFVSDGLTGPTLTLAATGTIATGVNAVPRLQILSGVTLGNTLTVTGSSNAILTGVIDGTGGITKVSGASGVLALEGANSYTGLTTINSGTIEVRNNEALGSTVAGTEVNAGGALTLSGGVTVTGESLFINGDGASIAGALRNLSGNNTWAGDITVGTNATTRVVSTTGTLTITGNIALSPEVGDQFVLQGDGNGVISGNISGAGRLTKSVTGGGRWILSGVNTYTGITTVSGGTLYFAKRVSLYNAVTTLWTSGNISVAASATLGLNVGGADEFTSADLTELMDVGFAANAGLALSTTNAVGGTFTISNSLTNTNLRLVKQGSGTLVLATANLYNGSTNIEAGTLRLTHANGLGSTTGGTAVTTGAILELVGGIAVGNETLTIRGGGSGDGAIISVSGNNSWAGTINVTSDTITRIGATADTFTINGNVVATGTAANGLVFQGNGRIIVNGVISGDGVNLTRSSNGTGLLVLAAANTYSGTTVISNGGIQVGVAGVGSIQGVEIQVTAGTLSGTGNVGTLARLGNAGNAFISPGDEGGAGTGSLTLSAGLTLNSSGGSKFKFNLATPGASDKIILTGGTFTSSTTGTNQFQITPGLGFDNGTYDLIDWSNIAVTTSDLDLADFTVTGLGAGKIGEFQFDVSGRILQLVVTPEPGRALLLLFAGVLGVARRQRPVAVC